MGEVVEWLSSAIDFYTVEMEMNSRIVAFATLFNVVALPAFAAPFIYNGPVSANPGDVITLNGSGFGSSPTVFFTGAVHHGTAAAVSIRADNNLIDVQVPIRLQFDVYSVAVSNGSATSSPVLINAPSVWTFDTPEVGTGDTFRIFGRNLYLSPSTPTVTLVDLGDSSIHPATINLSASDPLSLTVTAPSGITFGHTYKLTVSNGYSSSVSNATDATLILNGRGAAGTDHFALGVPWGADFVFQDGPTYNGSADNADHHVYNVMTDPVVFPHAVGDGITDDTAAIIAAINKATVHSGVVFFPAGNYRMASGSSSARITMKSGVVLQGHAASDTTITYGPASPPASGYSFTPFFWGTGTTNSGMADLTLTNVDTTSLQITSAQITGPNTSKIFLKRVNWNLGTGRFLFFNSGVDRVAIQDSTFTALKNDQFPNQNFTGNIGIGAMYIWQASNVSFKNNVISWFDGQNSLKDWTNGVVEGNIFTRRADQKVATALDVTYVQGGQAAIYPIGSIINRSFGRQLTLNEGKGVVMQSNTFDVDMSTGLDTHLEHNWYDGETIPAEGDPGRNDLGTISSATATTFTDATHGTWNDASALYEYVSIVSGDGCGQWRMVTGRVGNTVTVATPWSIAPSVGDHYTIFQPTFENVIIRNNTASGNPAGILIYHSYFVNTLVSGNTLTDNGGVYIRGDQRAASMTAMRNIEIISNTLTDTTGFFPSYVVAEFAVVNGTSLYGIGIDSLQVRNNTVNAKSGTPKYLFNEGYLNDVLPPAGQFAPGPEFSIQGTVFQGNTCNAFCNPAYKLSTGVNGAVIWDPTPTPPVVARGGASVVLGSLGTVQSSR